MTVIVVSNRGYGLEKDKALAGGLRNLDLSIPPVDFGKYAEACGARGFRVESPETLEETLREAFGTPGPSLVDVVCADVRLPEAGA